MGTLGILDCGIEGLKKIKAGLLVIFIGVLECWSNVKNKK